MRRSEKVKRFFVDTGETERVVGWSSDEGDLEAKGPFYELNEKLELSYKSVQKGAQFLVEAIRFWHNKRGFFCHDNTQGWEGEGKESKRVDLLEDEWTFSYKTPSTCGGCISGQRILDKIFGSRSRFNNLPFVVYHGDRSYSFRFDLLKHFAGFGHESTVQLIEKRKKEEARKKAEAEAERQQELRKEQNDKLAEKFSDVEISDDLRRQIVPHVDKTIVVVSKDIAIVKDSRSEWGSSGGIGYWDQIRVFCGGQSDMHEWQWRDRYSASQDRHDLRVNGIGQVEVSEGDGQITVKVELINKEYGNRSTSFAFDQPKMSVVQTLTTEEQADFTALVEEEVSRIMENLNRSWESKPEMLASVPTHSGYTSYRRPSIKQKEIRPDIGVAAFVAEEQIDHRGSDPQIRHDLYALTHDKEKAEVMTEDHGYGREGGAFLTILEIGPDRIVINTKSGKSTISLDR